MLFDNIFQADRKIKNLTLNQDRHISLSEITEEQFYIKPLFIDICQEKNSKFILFSAPGATGKSALAKFIAHRFGALYWDLSKIKLGENSLHGTLFRAMGTSGFAEFLSAFKQGEILLVIDAFDEADMISGRESIEHLLNDLNELAKDSQACSIVLLARTETAKFIKQYLQANEVKLSHYEISFFDESPRRDFVKEKLKISGQEITPAIEICIDHIFGRIKEKLDRDIVKSFLGYAPVLEAIAKTIEKEKNLSKLISKIEQTNITHVTSTEIINTILSDLMIREQEKVKNGFMERCASRFPDFKYWDEIYNEKEQLVRISSYILFGESSYNDYPIEKLPDTMKDDYEKVVNRFIRDHPFLLSQADNDHTKITFAGPAFRDYALAHALRYSEYEFLVDGYFNVNKAFSSSHFPSQLFFDFYTIFSESNLQSHHFPYLYDSFKSKETSRDKAYITISSDGITGLAEFSLCTNKKQIYSIPFNIHFTNNELHIAQLSNATISIAQNILIGNPGEMTRISDSSIEASRITWDTTNVRIEAYTPNNCLISAQHTPESKGHTLPTFEICTDITSNIKINFPDFARYHKLRQFAYEVDQALDIDISRFSHSLRGILIHFRQDRKDAPARHKDLIDNVILGHNKTKKIVFEFLESRGILFTDSKESKLYKLDKEEQSKIGINWTALTQGDTSALLPAYAEFVCFLREQG